MEPSPPLPPNDPLTAFFWEGAAEGRLMIQRCRSCGTYIHLPRPVCRNCLSFDLSAEEVSGSGSLYSFSVTAKPFHPFFVSRVPFVLAVVELVEQPALRLVSNLVDVAPFDVRIGMPLEVAFEALSPELTVPAFRPRTAVRA